jgi:ACS family glucarate transporter-like MFS transporter
MTTPEKFSGRPTWVRWQVVAILMGFTGLNHFHRQSLPAVVEQVMEECHFSEIDMGWIYFYFLLGYTVFMVPGGWLSDRRGGSFALVVSGFGTAGLVALTGLCGRGTSAAIGFGAFVLVRCLMGIFTAPLFPSAGRLITAWIPFGSRAWANGLVLGATTVGVALAPVAFGNLSDLVGWREACGVMGAVTALLTAFWLWYGRNRPADHACVNDAERALAPQPASSPARRAGGREFLALLRNPSLVFLTINYAAVGYYEYTLFYWMKYYFRDVRGYEEEASRGYTAIVTAAMIVAMPLGGILSDRLVRAWGYRAGRMSVPVLGMLASAVLLFVATRAVETMSVVVLFFLAHAAIGLCEAPTWVTGLELGGKNCGTSAAIVNTGGNLGGMLAQPITTYVAAAHGWTAGFTVASLVCVIGVVQWFGVRPVPSAGDGEVGGAA